jgi:hypothetical protein
MRKWIILAMALLLAGCATEKLVTTGIVPEGTQPETVVVCDFEALPNNLGGEIGVYGDGEPDWSKTKAPHSWIYEPSSPGGYDVKNVHAGQNSFQLINGEKGTHNTWASFSCNLGPTLDKNKSPIEVQSLNVSSYQRLVFWVKGLRGGEKFNVIFRDSHAPDYMPQVRVTPLVEGATKNWTKIEVPFSKVSWGIDLKNVVNIGIEFGNNVGNRIGTTLFIDDVAVEK